ncbi:hypothetical protein ECE50_022770 [Chitinophaga sp. Mgbs1]|uniref:Uncharacterized protein n=1 Tax=Chitinophaga solisilvae TaxID=1233460 RepID=A0A9Q5D2G6_9BACT|nr:hypothetical protein [Chitinophaga solisilvae]
MQQSNPTAAAELSPVYGIVITLVSIVLTIIFYATDLYGALWTGFCTSLVFFLGVLVSIIHYNSRHHEHTSVKAAFAMGFRTTLLAAAVGALVFKANQKTSRNN